MPIKINGTNTAANPSITGDDTDTGIVYGNDQIDFSIGGASKATIDSSGKLGIGETSPDEILHLKAANPVLEIEGTAGSSGDTGVFLNANGNHWFLRADNYGSQNGFSIKSGPPPSSTHR